MKTYKRVLSFGCSFTEGGGLNSPVYQHYLNGIVNTHDNDVKKDYIEYMKQNAYPAYLAKLLDCPHDNHGTSRSSNGLILKKLYENTCNIEDGTDILVTIQTTLLSRIMLYLDSSKKFLTINNLEDLPDNIKKYYKTYLKNFYNKQIEFNKLIQNIDVYTAYLKQKNFDIVWMMYETDSTIDESPTLLTFDDVDLSQFISKERLRLADLPNFPVNDTHFSVEGNKVIADRIVKHLEKYYG